jgi:NTE family protein
MGAAATLTPDERPGQAAVKDAWRFALVLGGGGMKGLAHVGALRALLERGWEPEVTVGTSIGALIGAAWASGFSITEIESLALSMKRHDIFAVAGADMAFRRLRIPGLYRSEPLEMLLRGLLGETTFADLPRRLVVASTDINSGTVLYWGLPGLTGVPVADAVFASCALPGFFPPRDLGGRFLVDGALVDNLPVSVAAAQGVAGVVAVDVGSSSVLRAEVQDDGFAAIFARASEIVFQQVLEARLVHWTGPAMLLVQPRVEHVPMFSFSHTRELIDEGYRATAAALDQAEHEVRTARGGIFPRRAVELRVARERCIGCGTCVALAPPGTFRMDATGKALPPEEPQLWSPVSGDFLRHCPTYAISARPVHPAADDPTAGGSRGTAPASA